MNLTYGPALLEDVDVLYRLNQELIDRYEDVEKIPYEGVLAWVRQKIEENIESYTRIGINGKLQISENIHLTLHGKSIDFIAVIRCDFGFKRAGLCL